MNSESLLLGKLIALSLLQLLPLLYLLKGRHVLLGAHLLGLFAFTTWQKFRPVLGWERYTFLVPLDEVIHPLFSATTLLLLAYFLTQLLLPSRINPPLSVALSPKKTRGLGMLLILLYHPFFSTSSWVVFTLTFQYVIAVFLVLNRGKRAWEGYGLVILYLSFHLLLREGTQLGFEIILASLFPLALEKRARWGVFILLSGVVLLLEMLKPQYRTQLGEVKNTPVVKRVGLLLGVLSRTPDKNLLRQPRLELSTETDEPLVRDTPRLTEMRVRRTIFSKELGLKALRDLELEEAYYKFLDKHMELLSLPRGVLNSNLIIHFPKFDRKRHWKGEFFRSLRRLGDESLENALTYTPHSIPFSNGESYKATLSTFIPRFVWPFLFEGEKPSHSIWNTFGRRYRILDSKDEKTSVSFTYLTEGYLFKGFLGLCLAAIGMGVLLSILEYGAQQFQTAYLRYGLLTLIASSVALPFDSFTIISKLWHRAGLILLIVLIIKGWERALGESKVKWPKGLGWKNYRPPEMEKAQPLR